METGEGMERDSGRRRLISLIVPVLNEEESLPLFHAGIAPVLADTTHDWEVIFVDDGSTDATLAMIAALHARDARFKAVSFSRNFGKEVALAAGFQAARGDAVIPMDVDLQDPPSLIPAFIAKWEEGYDEVLGVRRLRASDTRFKRLTARWFYHCYNVICGKRLVENAGDFRLLSRRAVDALNAMPERVRFTKGLYAWIGFKQACVEYERPVRAAGSSRFNTWKLWNFALDGITGFSSLPLRVWSYIGGAVALAGFAWAFWLIVKTCCFGADTPGWTSLMVVILCLGGLILCSLGIIGEYLGRLYEETKARPLYLVRDSIGLDEETRSAIAGGAARTQPGVRSDGQENR